MFTKFITRLKNWGMLPVTFFLLAVFSLKDAVKSILFSVFSAVASVFSAACMLICTAMMLCFTPIVALCTFVPKWDLELSLFEDTIKDEWFKSVGRNTVFA